MQNKRGQAALEFLMTYGWAILAAIIVIGVLAYFGVFSPGKFVPEATVVNPPFYANAWNIDSDAANNGATPPLPLGVISIEVQNNGGEDLTVEGFRLTSMKCGTLACDVTNSSLATSTVSIPTGDSAVLAVACPVKLVATDICKGEVTITYKKSSGTLQLTSSGTIAAKVAP